MIEALFRNSVFIVIALILKLNLSHELGEDAAIALSLTYSFSYSLYFGSGLLLGRPWEIKKPTGKMIRRYTTLALPLMLVTSVATFNGNIDKVVIQIFWAAVPTGAFYTGQTIALMVTSIATSMNAFFLPLLIRMKNTSKDMHNESIFEFERKISRYILPIVVPMVVLSAYILNIFSQVYFVYFPILSFLAIRAYISVINSPYSSAVASRSKLKTIAKIDIVMVTSNIILIFILVPIHETGRLGYIFGPSGAAFAAVLTGIASTLTYRINVSRIEKIGFNRTLKRQIPPALIQGVFLYAMSRIFDLRPFDVLVPVILVSMIIYRLVSVLIREVTFRELIGVITAFSPAKIRKTFSQ
jgi:O-antigen/teichoic acid export membrane protein